MSEPRPRITHVVFFDGTSGGFSIPGWDQPRHEEEMRWISRAKEAEALVAPLSIAKGELMCRVQFAEARVAALETLLVCEEKTNAVWKWGREVCAFLKETNAIFPQMIVPSRLLTKAWKLGIIPEPDWADYRTHLPEVRREEV